MNYTSRFDGKGDIYAKTRPKYAAELFNYLKNISDIPAGSVFADVGSDTGIFTEQLLNCGYKVFAVEPNADMRKRRCVQQQCIHYERRQHCGLYGCQRRRNDRHGGTR